MDGYLEFLSSLGDILLRHMQQLKHLSFEASEGVLSASRGGIIFASLPWPRDASVGELAYPKLLHRTRTCLFLLDLHAKSLKSLELKRIV